MKTLLSLATKASLALSVLSIGSATYAQQYTQVNLVANTSGIAPVTDSHLVNPWGLARSSGSPWWISDNGTGESTLYKGAGAIVPLVVTVPRAEPNTPVFPTGTPTGIIANGSPTDFLLAAGAPADFVFATIDGTIAAWNPTIGIRPGGAAPSTHAVTVVNAPAGTVYTGLTSATINSKRYLYAANFTTGNVDVYDNAFHKVTLPAVSNPDSNPTQPFSDDLLPPNFVPFNVQTIGNDVVVTFALHQPGNPFETDGPGNGYVDIFSSNGQLLQRLEHGDWLNAPWGVALAPLDFGTFSHALLIGQFAGSGTTENSGTIAAYDLATGKFLGQVQDSTGKALSISGLWALSPANSATASSSDPAGAPASELYFTAGPNHGIDGLFGYLKPVASQLTVGNDQ